MTTPAEIRDAVCQRQQGRSADLRGWRAKRWATRCSSPATPRPGRKWYLYGGSVRHPRLSRDRRRKALLKTIAQYAVQRRCGRLEWSVLDWDQPAIDFYLSIGAQPQDEWVRYRLTGDALRALCGVKRLASRSAPGVDLLAADQASTALFCSCGPASARRAPASRIAVLLGSYPPNS